MPHLKPLISRLSGHHLLVIGDVILDEYLTGTATRMSREAPIPVLEFESRRLIPGGAANPAMNIVSLGSDVTQVGVVGADEAADHLRHILQEQSIGIDGILTDTERPTTVKTRIMAHTGLRFPHQVARLDRLSRQPIHPQIEQQITAFIAQRLATIQAILFSDYQTGLLTPSLIDSIRAQTVHKSLVLAADAQGVLEKYHGITLVKCNAAEAASALSRKLVTDDDFSTAAQELCARLKLSGAMVITRGADGATVAEANGTVQHCPAPAVTDVFDTVGAGDTAVAVITLAVVAGASYGDAVTLANYASGLVVRRVGNYAPSQAELLAAVEERGIRG